MDNSKVEADPKAPAGDTLAFSQSDRRTVLRAWMPWIILTVFVFAWGTASFKNLFDTPNVKSAMAGVNFGLGLFGAMVNPQDTNAELDGGTAPQDLGTGGPGGLLNAGMGLLAGVGDQVGANFPVAHGDQALAGGTPGPGNTFNMPNAQLGVSPGAFEDKMGEMAAANKRHVTLGPN